MPMAVIRLISGALMAGGVFLFGGVVHADVWSVDDDLIEDPLADFVDLQSAVDAASHGDEIIVHPGTYTGAGDQVVDMQGKSVIMRSAGGVVATVIDGQGARRGILCGGGETESTVIEGFTIRNGLSDSGGGIRCVNAQPTIRDCVIELCEATGSVGGGISCYQSDASIESCIVRDNIAAGSGGGLCLFFSDAIVTSLEVSGNQTGINGGGIFVDASDANLSFCTIVGNTAQLRGGGVYFSGDWAEPAIDSSTIMFNACSGAHASGGGIYTYECEPTVTNCTISENSVGGSPAYSRGGGVAAYQSDIALHDCTVSGNTTLGYGGGFWSWESDAVLKRCDIDFNEALHGGGIALDDHSDAHMELCHISDNTAQRGGGMRVRIFSRPTLLGCLLRDNTATEAGGAVFGENGDYPKFGTSIFCANVPNHLNVASWSDLGGNCFADQCTDVNEDGLPDECQCLPDLDGDGVVSITDLLAVLDAWGCDSCPEQDINADGIIGIEDLLSVISLWGECPESG